MMGWKNREIVAWNMSLWAAVTTRLREIFAKGVVKIAADVPGRRAIKWDESPFGR